MIDWLSLPFESDSFVQILDMSEKALVKNTLRVLKIRVGLLSPEAVTRA